MREQKSPAERPGTVAAVAWQLAIALAVAALLDATIHALATF